MLLHTIACQRFQKEHESFKLIDDKLEHEKKTAQPVPPRQLVKLEDIIKEVQEAFPEDATIETAQSNPVSAVVKTYDHPSSTANHPSSTANHPSSTANHPSSMANHPSSMANQTSQNQKFIDPILDSDEIGLWECEMCTTVNTSQFIQCQTCGLFAIDDLNHIDETNVPMSIPKPKPQETICLNEWD